MSGRGFHLMALLGAAIARGAADRRSRLRHQNRGGWLARRLYVLGANPDWCVNAHYDLSAYFRALGPDRRASDRAGCGRGTAPYLACHSVVRRHTRLYPWPQHPASIKPDVLSHYLNAPSFIIRSLMALGGWSALSFLLPRTSGGPAGQLVAAFGLVFHAVVISMISLDWYLSLEAPFTSSSFGASVAISAMVGALAFAAATVPAAADDPAIGDLGGLLLATVLGITYMDFMTVLVIWYGDIPREEIWFVVRERFPWPVLAIVAFLLTSLFPMLALLLSRVRNARGPLRAVGGCVLVGLACYDIYLIVPAAGPSGLATAAVAIVVIGLGFFALPVSELHTIIHVRETANVR